MDDDDDFDFDPGLWFQLLQAHDDEVINLPVIYRPEKEACDFEAGMNEIELHYFRVNAALPNGFRLDQERNLIEQVKPGAQKGKAICNSIAVVCSCPATGRAESFLEVQFLNDEGRVTRLQLPNADLAGSNPAAIAILRQRGLYMPGTAREIAALLRAFRPKIKHIQTFTNGWSPDGSLLFGLKDGSIIAPNSSTVEYPSHLKKFEADTALLNIWKTDVAAGFSGSPIPLFFLVVALTGPLLTHLDIPCFAFNAVIQTSRGKSSLLELVAGVWPGLAVKNWSLTIAAAQDLCIAANSTLLILDEARMRKPVELVDLIMHMLNGRGRSARKQMGVSAADAPAQEWTLPVISSSEHALKSVMSQQNQNLYLEDGALYRFIDICAKDRQGEIWIELHGCASRFDMLAQMSRASKSTLGIAGPMFVQMLLNGWSRLEPQLPRLWQEALDELLAALKLSKNTAPGEVMRVLKYFAGVSVAGRIAAEFRILPQNSKEVRQAVVEVATEWLYPSKGTKERSVIASLKAWIAQNSETGLIKLDVNDRPVRSRTRTLGWYDDQYFYLLPTAVSKAIGREFKLETALSVLIDANIVVRGGSQDSRQYRMGAAITGRPYVVGPD